MFMACSMKDSVRAYDDLDADTLGYELVMNIWENVQSGDYRALKTQMAPGFQSGYGDKIRSVDEQLKLLMAFPIEDFELKNVNVTKYGTTVIVTYTVDLSIEFMKRRLASDPQHWMSVFVDVGDGWKWLGQASLK